MGNIKGMRIKFILAVLVQLIFLCVMIGGKAYTLAYGEKILLKSAPVDPTSLFSGDYIRLNYDISTIEIKNVNTDIDFSKAKSDYNSEEYRTMEKQLQKVYVKLQKKDGDRFWSVVSMTHDKPVAAPDELVIMGHDGEYLAWTDKPSVRLKYGIESYYIAEGTGAQYEKSMSDKSSDTYVEVSVDRNGSAGIIAIYQDGKKINQ